MQYKHCYKPAPCNGSCCRDAATHLLIALSIAESHPLHSLSCVSWGTGLTSEAWCSVHTSHSGEAWVVTALQRGKLTSTHLCCSSIQAPWTQTSQSKAMLHAMPVCLLFRALLTEKYLLALRVISDSSSSSAISIIEHLQS